MLRLILILILTELGVPFNTISGWLALMDKLSSSYLHHPLFPLYRTSVVGSGDEHSKIDSSFIS